MYERLDACPVCRKATLANDRIIKDHSISQESFALSRCQTCDFLFTNPRPLELGKYYESEEYRSHTDEGKGIIDRVYRKVRNINLDKKIDLVIQHTATGGNLLDVGTGTGYFLAKAKSRGWDIEGVEPNPKAQTFAQDQLQTSLYTDVFEVPQEKQFDAITLWHVLEHLPKLNETLEHFQGLITKKGRIFVAVPNVASWDAQHYGEHWAGYDVPRHLYHFTQPTMKRLLKEHGYSLVSVEPMVFDAYYVSLLSEKYQNGKSRYIQAFRNGWKSNQWAKANQNNYSSLIYVIKKK